MKGFEFLKYYKGEDGCPYSGDEYENEIYEWKRERMFHDEVKLHDGKEAYLEMGEKFPGLLEELGLKPEFLEQIKALSAMEKAWFAYYYYHFNNGLPLYFRKANNLL